MELWAMRLERKVEEAPLLALLPTEQRERISCIRHERRRQESLCAWWLLCRALGWQRLPEIARSDLGKPWFPGHPNLHFNLSHTEGAVLVGIAEQPIGVDIERIRPVRDRLLRQLDCGDAETFFPVWVRREARAKRLGTSIGTMLRQEPPLAAGEYVHPLETFPGYTACVACGEATVPATEILRL